MDTKNIYFSLTFIKKFQNILKTFIYQIFTLPFHSLYPTTKNNSELDRGVKVTPPPYSLFLMLKYTATIFDNRGGN